MPPMYQNYSILLDLKASNASNYSSHPTSKPASQGNMTAIAKATCQPSNKQASKQVSKPAIQQAIPCGRSGGTARPCPQGDGGDGDGGFPRTPERGQGPGPTCPGTKYPVRGIPHFDVGILPP